MVETLSAEELAVLVERELGVGDVVAALRVGDESLSQRSAVHFTGRPSLPAAQVTIASSA